MKLWIATDKDGKQCGYADQLKPERANNEWLGDNWDHDCDILFDDDDKPLPKQTWGDNPELVEFVKKEE